MYTPDVDAWNTIAGRSRRAEAAARQTPRRAAEYVVRKQAAVLCNELADHGQPYGRVAKRLRLPRRTNSVFFHPERHAFQPSRATFSARRLHEGCGLAAQLFLVPNSVLNMMNLIGVVSRFFKAVSAPLEAFT